MNNKDFIRNNCPSVDDDGTKCGLPEHHYGRCQNGMAHRTWQFRLPNELHSHFDNMVGSHICECGHPKVCHDYSETGFGACYAVSIDCLCKKYRDKDCVACKREREAEQRA